MGDAGEGEGVLFRDRAAVCMHCGLKWVHALVSIRTHIYMHWSMNSVYS